jgi:proteic killer suppression protein
VRFANAAAEDIANGRSSKAALRTLPVELHARARRQLFVMLNARNLSDLKAPPSNHLERLKHDRAGQHSIRVNQQYRICFTWLDGQAQEIEIVDYH